MPLSAEDIAKLLAKPEPTKRNRTRGPDTSVRDIATWFTLAHKLFDESTSSNMACENPECTDPRPTGQKHAVVAKVNDKHMCRFCFLSGWLA